MITVTEAARRKGVAHNTLYLAIRRGELPAVTQLGRLGVLWSDVEKLEIASFGARQGAKKKRGPGRPRRKATEGDT